MSTARKFGWVSDETKKKCIDAIIFRINESVDDEIGMITAEDVLDLVTENIADDIYDRAIEDVKKLLNERHIDTNIEIDLMKSKQ
jgi:uncharacterized protein (DUF2164 family)